MLAAIICETYGWTWFEYQEQPAKFIEVIKVKMQLEGEKTQRDIKKQK
jgi:hypothetical protein